MSLFKKVLAQIGIGSATVDTKLENEAVFPGGKVRGVVEINGGNVEQKIDEIYLSLYTLYTKEVDDRKVKKTGLIEKFRMNEPFYLKPNEKVEIPFSFQLPVDTPLTLGGTNVWIATGLDIKQAIDPTDKDVIRVLPNQLIGAVFKATEELGFRLRKVECEEAPYRLRTRLPFIQEFEFVPITGPYRRRLDELEMVFFPYTEDKMEILMEVDRRARGIGGLLAEALELDETKVRMTVTSADIPTMTGKLERMIERFS